MQPIPNTKSKGYLRQRFEEQKREERRLKIEKRLRFFVAVGVAALIIILKFKPL